MNIGILTSGGLCPGLNTVVKTLTLREMQKNNTVLGFKGGFKGLNDCEYINLSENAHLLCDKGGCILSTSRVQLSVQKSMQNIENLGLSKLYSIGGNGTLCASKLLTENSDINVIGIAKTIDNDIYDLESFGTFTAIEQTRKFIKCAYNEAHGMNSIIFVETMGRNSGFIALESTLCESNIVNVCLIPEIKSSVNEIYNKLHTLGSGVVVVSEGVDYTRLFKRLEANGIHCKKITPGYAVRSGNPHAYDIHNCVNMACNAVTMSETHNNIIIGTNSYQNFKDFKIGEKQVKLHKNNVIQLLKELGIIHA